MGLDMYLKKRKKSCKRSIEEICNGDYEDYKRDLKEIAYWRKSNQIHKWFVDNIQNGVDDCNYYLVSKEKIEELRDICTRVLKETKLIDGQVLQRDYTENGVRIKEYGLGKVVDNKEICEELLPTQQGFFFGSYDYDEWYLDDIKYTRDRLNAILDILDFEENEVYYGSSW